MRDFDIISHSFLGGNDIDIVPLFDVHLGNPDCMEKEFVKFVKDLEKRENTYIVIGGDLLENGTRNSVGDSVFEQTMPPGQQKLEMMNILKPVASKILCLVEGNHERRSSRDANTWPIFDIACMLNIEHLYRRHIAFVDIQLGEPKRENGERSSGHNRPNYMLAVIHGSGGGVYSGSGLNRLERFGNYIEGLDALIAGHVHKAITSQPGRLRIDRHNKKIDLVKFKVVSSTSWLRYGGYAIDGMMGPSSFDMQVLHLSGKGKDLQITS